MTFRNRNHLGLLIVLAQFTILNSAQAEKRIELTEPTVQRIWNQGAHNAFSSLVRFQNKWYCSFRSGLKHVAVGDLGTATVISSSDSTKWEVTGQLTHELYDLRDPKLSIMPDGRLMMVGGALDSRKKPGKRFLGLRSFVAFSSDGKTWTKPQIVLGDWEWLWRITWHKGIGYGMAYRTRPFASGPREERTGTLYKTIDGLNFEPIKKFQTEDGIGETTLRFEADSRMRMVMRRDGGKRRALLGTAQAPYTEWTLKDCNYRVGGPDLVQLPDGQWWVGTRVREGGKTTIARIDFDAGTINPVHVIDGKGDCSYPGLVVVGDQLWMSFYSSHEEKTAIYLAKFDFLK